MGYFPLGTFSYAKRLQGFEAQQVFVSTKTNITQTLQLRGYSVIYQLWLKLLNKGYFS